MLLYLIMRCFVVVAALVGIVFNGAFFLLFVFNSKLRHLSVGGLIMLITFNDWLYDVQMVVEVAEIYNSVNNVTISVQSCAAKNIGYLVFGPASKILLLMITFDRLLAIFSPMWYRNRNHTRHAIVGSVIVFIHALFWMIYGIQGVDFTNEIMTEPCSTSTVYPLPVLQLLVAETIMIDLIVYVLNGVLLFKVMRFKKSSIRTTTVNHKAKQDKEKQIAITKSVLAATGAHFLLATVPLFAMFAAAIAEQTGLMSLEMINTVGVMALLCSTIESTSNVYIYINRLPFVKSAIRRHWQRFKE